VSIHSFHFGHPITYRNGRWYFEDDGSPVDFGRIEELPRLTTVSVEALEHHVCCHCGQPPTAEGYDACLGHIRGAIAACCGHGIERGYIMWEPQ